MVHAGCTSQMVVATPSRPFLANISDIDTVAYFGELLVEEDEVINIFIALTQPYIAHVDW